MDIVEEQVAAVQSLNPADPDQQERHEDQQDQKEHHVEKNGIVFQRCSVDERKKSFKSKILSYPRAVFFCLGCEFSERFSYYGTRSILVLYFIMAKGLLPAQAKLLFHVFICLAHFTPLLGSILADAFYGKFKVIFGLSLFYCIGHVLITVGALPQLSYLLSACFDFGGFLIIAIASGGMRPCVAAFAGDQFGPKMDKERQQFFSFYYFAINLGALLALLIIPGLRAHVHCFGDMSCFPLAFLVPSAFILFSTILFISGKKFYTIYPPTKNIIGEVSGCIYHGIKEKIRIGGVQRKHHWLDYAYPKYPKQLISDINVLLSITVLYLPIILFSALYDQMGSTWVLQADMMNGRLGRLTILPDQLCLLNAVLILILVPIFEGFVYPFFDKMNVMKTPLRRMGWGGIITATTFVVAGFLQIAIDSYKIPLPTPDQGRLAFFNAFSSNISLYSDHEKFDVNPKGYTSIDTNASLAIRPGTDLVQIAKGSGSFYILTPSMTLLNMSYTLSKTPDHQTRLYILPDYVVSNYQVDVMRSDKSLKLTIDANDTNSNFVDLEPGFFESNEFTLKIKAVTGVELPVITLPLDAGSAFVLVLLENNAFLISLISANTVSILWQFPQYLMITVAEILFLVTGLEFSYSQAPESMKTVVQALWLLTSAFGNLLAAVISGSNMITNPAGEFFLYAALMFLVMVAFIIIARGYKYADEIYKNIELSGELVLLNKDTGAS